MTLKSKIKNDKKYYIVIVKTGKRTSLFKFNKKKNVLQFEKDMKIAFPKSEVIHTKYKKKLSR